MQGRIDSDKKSTLVSVERVAFVKSGEETKKNDCGSVRYVPRASRKSCTHTVIRLEVMREPITRRRWFINSQTMDPADLCRLLKISIDFISFIQLFL